MTHTTLKSGNKNFQTQTIFTIAQPQIILTYKGISKVLAVLLILMAPAATRAQPVRIENAKNIIYRNDFSTESLGELPTGWNSNGNGSVVHIKGMPGSWLQLYKDAFYLTDNRQFFSESFTIEFDLLLYRTNRKAGFPQLGFGMMAANRDSTIHSRSIKDYKKYFASELKLQPYDYNGSHMHYESFEKNEPYLETEIKKYPVLEQYFNTPIHISMQVQNERLRIWFNDTKLYDLPKAIKAGIQLNQLFFFVKWNGSSEDEVSYNITNIKIAR